MVGSGSERSGAVNDADLGAFSNMLESLPRWPWLLGCPWWAKQSTRLSVVLYRPRLFAATAFFAGSKQKLKLSLFCDVGPRRRKGLPTLLAPIASKRIFIDTDLKTVFRGRTTLGV